MSNTNIIKNLFPVFNQVDLLEELSHEGFEKTFIKDDIVIRKGEYMKFMPLILSGSIKVMREDDNGNEMLLYYLEGGNTCAMSITCCLKEEKSNILAIAEEETSVLMIPISTSDAWMKKYTNWRNFILESYASRMNELLQTLDAIAFYSLDERLLKYLKDRSTALKKNEFSITHNDIAKELNSSREAVSRLLKKLENLGKVKLGRNRIELLIP